MIGDIITKEVKINNEILNDVKNKFISLDTETTGLDYTKNTIIEIGMSLFENGVLTKKFESLLNVNDIISDDVSNLTGITNEMLSKAPDEKIVYNEIVEFLGDALDEKTIIVAHNAKFDMGFIENNLKRYGYIGSIRYIDTLNLSRHLIKGLFNYKQDTVATYFNIINPRAHRALTDAITCGNIFVNLIKIYETNDQTLNISTQYDNQFEKNIIERGLIYYRNNLVNNYICVNDECNATITGTNKYEVSLKIIDNKVNGTCTCMYYHDSNKLCKHIYALLLKYINVDKK